MHPNGIHLNIHSVHQTSCVFCEKPCVKIYKQPNIVFYNSSSLDSSSAALTMRLRYWHLNCHPPLSYFPALAEMGNFVFQRQEASLSTGWGLGEAKENDPRSLSHPAWQSVCLWCLRRETGKVEPHQTHSTQPLYLFPWVNGIAPAPQVLFDVHMYLYTLTWIWPFLMDSESSKEEYGGKAPSDFCFL